MLNIEQIQSANKANVDAYVDFANQFIANIGKVAELNIAAAKATLGDAATQAKSVLNVKDAQDFTALQSNFFQPAAEKATSYGRQLFDIAQTQSAELTKAFEAKVEEAKAGAQQAFTSLVETATKNAPQGSEPIVALFKNTLTTAQNAVETAQKAAKQAFDTAQTQFATAAQAATQTVTETVKPTAKKR